MINGKKRDMFEIEPNASEDVLKETAFARDVVKKNMDGKQIVKVIVVPNKLVNIVVK